MDYLFYAVLFLTVFAFGVFVGVYGSAKAQAQRARRLTDEMMSNLKSSSNDLDEFFERLSGGMNSQDSSISKRLKEVSKLQKELMNLAIAVDEPQRNALDGRGKQFQGGNFESIKDEVDKILQSIFIIP